MSEDQYSQEVTRAGWLIEVGQYERAMQILAQLLAGYPDNASITYKVMALTHIRMDRFGDAEAAARTVSSSNLLKCAVAGADPNWGRILSQLGTVPEDVCPFNPDEVDVTINGITIFSHGAPQPNRDAVDMSPRETRIDIELSAGPAQATVWTNDLTHGYVTINADYTT